MSGNQYAYSIEIKHGNRTDLELVAKNRKLIRGKVARLITKYDKTHYVSSQKNHRDLTLLVFTHGGTRAVSDRYKLRARHLMTAMPEIEIIVTAWVIKAAKPEGPVRGTLKERMGDRAWTPTITLDEEEPSRGFADPGGLNQ